MDLDRQSIEKRDFPISRRGYDPAAVDVHLRGLASAVEELQRAAASPGPDSLAATAGSQVQAIVAAAEAAAAEIESDARTEAERVRAQADADAEQTRADAIAKAQAHVAAVGHATATLLARVQSLDGETGALVESLRAGATRLAGDLAAVETNMSELYDAASGRARAEKAGEDGEVVSAVATERPEPHVPPPPPDVPAPPVAESSTTTTSTAAGAQIQTGAAPAPAPPPLSEPPAPSATVGEEAAANGDADSARLVALNMALNGDSREETDRYIAENYEVEDREKLLDEVYAAIEG